MHIDLLLVLASALVGFLVGLTGMGGGALMTPMLVLLFGVTPSAAISSDLIAAFFMKPLGVAIHWRRGTVQGDIVKYLCLGSVPAAFLGTWVMHLEGHSLSGERRLQVVLGVALILGAGAMIARFLIPQHSSHIAAPFVLRRVAIVAIGVGGGFMVGLTSVGAGSLILVLLTLVYPSLRSDQLVGTDLAQSIPLTLAATLGTFVFGHVQFSLTASIILGSIPAVVIGALLSAREASRVIRPFIAGVTLLSGLKYIGAPLVALGVVALVTFSVLSVAALRTRPAPSPAVLDALETVP
ncbi:MAG: sulfite exporter TauE/SafE family protein [Acidobacteria bacterium]|nr:sulfite exporter TauE/SafE family protein [Acidobacteriota bacterium]